MSKIDASKLYLCVTAHFSEKFGAVPVGAKKRGRDGDVQKYPNFFVEDGNFSDDEKSAIIRERSEVEQPPVDPSPSRYLPPEKTRRCIRACQVQSGARVLRYVSVGDVLRADDPMVKTLPTYFERVAP